MGYRQFQSFLHLHSISKTGSLTFHLRENPQSQEDIAIGQLPLSEVTEQKYYRFDFIPQNNSQGKDYFLQVDVDDEGEVEVFTSEADSYLDGSLYVDQSPQEAQLGFQLEYDRVAYHSGFNSISISMDWCSSCQFLCIHSSWLGSI